MAAILSLEDGDGLRCIDVLCRPDGGFGFKEFRREPEDHGRWTLVADYSDTAYATQDDALRGAARAIGWFEWPRGG